MRLADYVDVPTQALGAQWRLGLRGLFVPIGGSLEDALLNEIFLGEPPGLLHGLDTRGVVLLKVLLQTLHGAVVRDAAPSALQHPGAGAERVRGLAAVAALCGGEPAGPEIIQSRLAIALLLFGSLGRHNSV